MIILDDIPTTDKETLLIEDIKNPEKIKKMLDYFTANQINSIQSESASTNDVDVFEKRIKGRNILHRDITYYYNVYDRSFQRRLEYGKTSHKFELPISELFLPSDKNKYSYNKELFINDLVESIIVYLNNNVDTIISDYTTLLLSDNKLTLKDSILPEDMSANDIIDSYNDLRLYHKTKVSDIYFSENDILRLNKYSFEEMRDNKRIPKHFKHLKKFLKRDDMEYIVINSVLNPYIDAAKRKDIDFINNYKSFFIKVISEFRVFSEKKVKLKYEDLVDELIKLNDVKTNNFLVHLDFNFYLKSTTRKSKLLSYDYDFITNKIKSIPDEKFMDSYLEELLLENSRNIIINDKVSFIKLINEKSINFKYNIIDNTIGYDNLLSNFIKVPTDDYEHIIRFIDAIKPFENNLGIIFNLDKIKNNISKTNEFFNITDIETYSIVIRGQKDS